VVLSTDDVEIAEVGRAHGLDVPFMRAPELAADDTPTLPVVQDVLRRLSERGDQFDAVCLLQPTSPFRSPGLIDRCVELLDTSGADSVVTVLPVPAEHHPGWVYLGDPGRGLTLSTGGTEPIPRRQLLPPAYHREGSVYVTRTVVVLGGSLYGNVVRGVEVEATANIDDEDDWRQAEIIAARQMA
jgi:CMP-N-acetylneuraminic acid synthetase